MDKTLSRVLTHPSVAAFGDFRVKCHIFTGRTKVLIAFLRGRHMDIEDEKRDLFVWYAAKSAKTKQTSLKCQFKHLKHT